MGGKTLARALGRAGKSVAVGERSSQMYGGSFGLSRLQTSSRLTCRRVAMLPHRK
jgi:hypothetical protein